MFSERGGCGRLPRIRHVTPLGEIRRVGPGDLLSVLRSLEREAALRHHSRKGRRHEFDFGDAPVGVEIYSGEETVEGFQHPAWLGAWRVFVWFGLYRFDLS